MQIFLAIMVYIAIIICRKLIFSEIFYVKNSIVSLYVSLAVRRAY